MKPLIEFLLPAFLYVYNIMAYIIEGKSAISITIGTSSFQSSWHYSDVMTTSAR
jgi:hypothetical protein